MEEELFDLQKLTFFTEGNTFTGSRTKDWEKKIILRYLVRPDREKECLSAFAWNEDVCFERAKDPVEREFPITDEGLGQIRLWLKERFESL